MVNLTIDGRPAQVPEGTTILEAARLAAAYSKGATSSRVPVDYTLRKYVKKPGGAKPGFVIYEKNYTAYVTADKSEVQKLSAENNN